MASGFPPAATTAPFADEPRPRDFVARIRRRDMRSARAALRRQSVIGQRVAGIVAVGVLPVGLALVGWGSPQGIVGAQAHPDAATLRLLSRLVPAPVARDEPGLLSPALAAASWNRTLAGLSERAGLAASAPPLRLSGTAIDRWRALQCLTTAIYYEAATEPLAGQRAVAQVVLNRVAHPAFPKTVCGVVYQGSERPGCQFTFACDGSLARAPARAVWDRVRKVAQEALEGNVYAPVGLATHYHTSAVHPAWENSLALLGVVGAHRFYGWRGAAGQARLFNAIYVGGEPLAAPHPHSWTPGETDLADPVTLERAFEQGRLAAQSQNSPSAAARPAAEISAIGTAPATLVQDRLPPPDSSIAPPAKPGANAGTVRPEYENAGKWIAEPHP